MKRYLSIILVICLSLGLCMFTGCSKAKSGGDSNSSASIYWLCPYPEAKDTLSELADEYAEKTGVRVDIEYADPDTYGEKLSAALASGNAPTLFNISCFDELIDLAENCADLSGSDIVSALSDGASVLAGGEKTLAVPFFNEYCGLIVNTKLLKSAGVDVSAIKDLASLKNAAEQIHADSESLGFDAFAPAFMDGELAPGFAEPLANAAMYYESAADGWDDAPATVTGAYLDALRTVWDMYLECSPAQADGGTAPLESFGKGKAAFCPGSSADMSVLTGKYGMSENELSMIPLYMGVDDKKQGLCSKCMSYLAVNASASEDTAGEAEKFVLWLISDKNASDLLSDAFGQLPYKNSAESGNAFAKLAQSMSEQGKSSTAWAYRYTPNAPDWYAVFAHALAMYAQDGNWNRVVTAYVDGWDVQYTAARMPN